MWFYLLDSALMTLTTVTIPPGSEKQLETVLPFLLEDEIAQDVMQVHVALLAKEDNLAHVAVIEHKHMQSSLSRLSEFGIVPRRVLPDCLCLPDREAGYSAAFFQDKWLMRFSQTEGGSAEQSWLPIWLDSVLGSQPKGIEGQEQNEQHQTQIFSLSPLPPNVGANWHYQPSDSVMKEMTKGAQANHFNMLTGRYKPQNQLAKYLKPWRGAAVVGALLVAVMMGESVMNIYQMEEQLAQYKAETRKEVRAMFPDNKRIPNTSFLKRLYNNEIAQLSGGGSDVHFLAWLAEVAPMIKQVSSIQLDAIRFDQARGELRLNMSGKDFADFEKLRESLSAKFKTELGQLNRNESKVTGAFVLERISS